MYVRNVQRESLVANLWPFVQKTSEYPCARNETYAIPDILSFLHRHIIERWDDDSADLIVEANVPLRTTMRWRSWVVCACSSRHGRLDGHAVLGSMDGMGRHGHGRSRWRRHDGSSTEGML